MLIFSRAPLFLWAEAITTACYTQNRSIIHRRFNKTPYELIKKPDNSFLHVFRALCYPKNDREDTGKLGAKGDIGFFIGYSADSYAYRVYNRRTKKIMETINVIFDELSAMAFEQSNMYDEYIGGQPLATSRTVPAAQAPQVCQTLTASTTIANTASTPTNSSSPATNIPNTSQDVDGLKTQQHAQQQENQAPLQPETVADNVPNAMFDENTFVNPFSTPSISAAESSSLQYVNPSNMHKFYQPYPHECFIDVDHPSHVYKLKKALYGLKQAPKAWYNELSTFLLPNHFFKGTIDPTLFISRFKMSMMGEMMFFLGLQVNQSPCGIFINQSNYVLEILKKYGMKTCDPIGTPMEIKDKLDLDQNGTPGNATKYRNMIGALMYLTSSRPDIVHVTCLCAWYQAKPTEKHLKEVKRIFCYPWGIVNTGIWYTKASGFELTGFSDADYAGHKDTFKSTFGRAQFLGEKLVSWSSKKQDCTALSTAEAEYMSLSTCCAQVLWMRTQLTDCGFYFNKIPIYYDSKSAIAISCNLVQHSRTKHIVVCHHFIKEHVEKGTIELYFVKTGYQMADLFTKALSVERFNYLVRRHGMRSLSPQELERLAKSR
nr:copia protein [Tanacetum cinerariifolium]